mmetsp:Transcript_6617/g.28216  ORF Transcript_6617/g.28216 Transcript_6617/m.28216 type:complete len:359 (+) Transcript_6617:551-1627(+)
MTFVVRRSEIEIDRVRRRVVSFRRTRWGRQTVGSRPEPAGRAARHPAKRGARHDQRGRHVARRGGGGVERGCRRVILVVAQRARAEKVAARVLTEDHAPRRTNSGSLPSWFLRRKSRRRRRVLFVCVVKRPAVRDGASGLHDADRVAGLALDAEVRARSLCDSTRRVHEERARGFREGAQFWDGGPQRRERAAAAQKRRRHRRKRRAVAQFPQNALFVRRVFAFGGGGAHDHREGGARRAAEQRRQHGAVDGEHVPSRERRHEARGTEPETRPRKAFVARVSGLGVSRISAFVAEFVSERDAYLHAPALDDAQTRRRRVRATRAIQSRIQNLARKVSQNLPSVRDAFAEPRAECRFAF